MKLDARGLSDEEALWKITGSAFDILRDDAALRKGVLSPNTMAAHFNRLRSNYPERREFSAFRVQLLNGGDTLLKKIQSLGFAVERSGDRNPD